MSKAEQDIARLREFLESFRYCYNDFDYDSDRPSDLKLLSDCGCDRFAHNDNDGVILVETVLRVLDGKNPWSFED